MIFRNSVKIAVMAAMLAVMCVSAQAAGNSSGYAWSENTGWLNFSPTGGGVTVYSDHLEGYAWNENIGWIRLGTSVSGAAGVTYTNTSAADYGVNNNGSGVLSGYGWSENAGWIKFNPTGGGVSIDASGNFIGYAWGENIGWIHFANTTPAYKVATTWTPTTAPTAGVTLNSVSAASPYTAAAAATGLGIGERGFLWYIPPGPDTGWGGSESGLLPAGYGAGNFSLNLTGLKVGTKYHVKAYIKVGDQIIESDDTVLTASASGGTGGTGSTGTATTGSCAPKVVTGSCTVNSDNTVSASGQITDVGCTPPVTVYGFVYAKHPAPYTGSDMYKTGDMALAIWDQAPAYQGISFSGTIKNLLPGTYYLRSYAHNDQPDSDAAQTASLAYGADCTFTIACTDAVMCPKGDVNGNGYVDLADAVLVLKILAGIPVADYINPFADVNGDKKIGHEELGFILQKVAGLR